MLPLDYDTSLRYNELLKEAEQYRLAKRATAGKLRVQVRTLQSLGTPLFHWGKV